VLVGRYLDGDKKVERGNEVSIIGLILMVKRVYRK